MGNVKWVAEGWLRYILAGQIIGDENEGGRLEGGHIIGG